MDAYPFDPGLALHRAVEARLFVKQTLDTPLLDLGCSDGQFAKLCFESKGLNISSGLKVGLDAVRTSLQNIPKFIIYDYTISGNALSLPFQNDAFGTIICNSVLTHIPDLQGVFLETHRILKPHGRLIFSVPSIFFGEYLFSTQILKHLKLFHQGSRLVDRYNRKWKQYHLLDIDRWEEILNQIGFQLLQSRYYLSLAASFWWSLYFFLARIGFRQWRLGQSIRWLFQMLKMPNKVIKNFFCHQMTIFIEENGLDNGGSLFLVAEKITKQLPPTKD